MTMCPFSISHSICYLYVLHSKMQLIIVIVECVIKCEAILLLHARLCYYNLFRSVRTCSYFLQAKGLLTFHLILHLNV